MPRFRQIRRAISDTCGNRAGRVRFLSQSGREQRIAAASITVHPAPHYVHDDAVVARHGLDTISVSASIPDFVVSMRTSLNTESS